MNIKILVVDDHEVLRAGIKFLVDRHDDMQIIGEADNGLVAVKETRKLKPDIVIMDIAMPGINGIEATRQIKWDDGNIHVLGLSVYADKHSVICMLKAGARGYVVKDCISQELVEAIYTVHGGQIYLCGKAADILIESIINDEQIQDSRSPMEKLTEKECQMLKLVAQGQSGKQIAYELGISIKTVDGRKRKIMEKLKLHSIADMTRFAIKEDMVTLDIE